jgi:hypothetical protein
MSGRWRERWWPGSGSEPDPGAPDGEDTTTLGARAPAWMALGALLVALVATPFGVDLGGEAFGRVVDGALEVETDQGWEPLEVPGRSRPAPSCGSAPPTPASRWRAGC